MIFSRLNPLFYVLFSFVVASPAFATWSYSVKFDASTQILHIAADLPEGRMVLNNEGAMYVSKIALEDQSKTLVTETNSWIVPRCGKGLCKITYDFNLGAMAKRAGRRDDIMALGQSILSSPSLWLLRPLAVTEAEEVTIRLEVKDSDRSEHKPSTHIATGLFPSPKDPQLFVTQAFHLVDLPFTLIGPYNVQTYDVEGAQIELAIIPAAYKVTETQIAAWSKRATDALVKYYGKFPVPHLLVVVVPREFYNGPGKSYGDGGAVTLNPLSLKATEAELRKDWVMTHEMVHLALPSVPYQHHWLEEGLATYVEPIARIRSGELEAEAVFGDVMDGIPKGLPRDGDKGLDGPPTWGRTYWGGALFSLLADVELREKSKGKVGLEQALRGINAAGGSMAVSWDMDKVLKAGDQATASTVLSKLYQAMKDKPVKPDLEALWLKLGVSRDSKGVVHFDDKAPLAFVRRAIIKGS